MYFGVLFWNAEESYLSPLWIGRAILSQGLFASIGYNLICRNRDYFLEPQLTQFNNMPSLDEQISMWDNVHDSLK